MDINAVASPEGIELLKADTFNRCNKYALVGFSDTSNSALDGLLNSYETTYADLEPYMFYTSSIQTLYFDENGELTFELLLEYSLNTDKYIYGIAILSDDNKLISHTQTPKIAKVEGIGGNFTYKIAIKGEAGEIVFSDGAFVTMNKFKADLDTAFNNHKLEADPHEQYAYKTAYETLEASLVGIPLPFGSLVTKIPKGFLLCDGSELDRVDFARLFECLGTTYNQDTDTDETKFRLPDLRGKFLRGVGGNSADLGIEQGDAIRNITGDAYLRGFSINTPTAEHPTGAFYTTTTTTSGGKLATTSVEGFKTGFDASRQVPTASENRPVNMAMNYIMKY